MLLLYRKFAPFVPRFSNEFTFHYASTLSKVPALQGIRLSQFTFHYASTLSKIPRSLPKHNSIYIPLCFYFIEVMKWLSIAKKLIYIPLCFYFIWLQLFRFHTLLHNLHSTMLLLYPDWRSPQQSFAHHLHSTMLLLYPWVIQKPLDAWLNLHSTMLLLYRVELELI